MGVIRLFLTVYTFGYVISFTIISPGERPVQVKEHRAISAYRHLLKNMVKVNEDRVNAIRKLIVLQNTNVAEKSSRSDGGVIGDQPKVIAVAIFDNEDSDSDGVFDDDDDDEELGAIRVINVLENNMGTRRDYGDMTNLSNMPLDVLTGDNKKCLHKYTRELCVRACKHAIKKICFKYECRRKIYYKLRDKCGPSCKLYFY